MSSSTTGHRSIWLDLQAVGLEQAWCTVAGISTRYWKSGDAGDDVVFLHGTGGHVEAFSRNIGPFGLQHRTWALDLIGHGGSDLSDSDLEVDDYVVHLLAFLDHMDMNRVCLVGVSLGGWVASRFAILHPDRVRALVLVTPGGSQADRKVMQTIRSTTTAAVEELGWDTVRSRLEYLVHDPKTIPDDLVAVRLAVYGRDGMASNMPHVLALQVPEVRARNIIDADGYGQISSPTLVVWTQHDPTAPVAEGRRLAGLIPGARFLVLDDCAHWPQFEKPDEFNRLVLDFLDETSATDRAEANAREQQA